jgi:hypothetical protein
VLHCRSQLLKELDTDESGTIEFKEFLAMLSTITEGDGNDLDDSGEMRVRAQTAVLDAQSGDAVKEGAMDKFSTTGRFRNWKRRHFVLLPDRIVYYKTPQDKELGKVQGEVVFVHGALVVDAPSKKPDAFALKSSKDLYLFTPNPEEKQMWIAAIELAIKRWERGIVAVLQLLLGEDPQKATKQIMAGDQYSSVMQKKNGVGLSPIFVRLGSPVPTVFNWVTDDPNISSPTRVDFQTRLLGQQTEWEHLEVKGNRAVTKLRPGVGYSFLWKKDAEGEDEGWLSPLMQQDSLLNALKRVPIIGPLISTLPLHMQHRVDEFPEGKVKGLLLSIGKLLPLNPFDIHAFVTEAHGFVVGEEPVLSKAQQALKKKDAWASDPETRFAVRSGLLAGSILAIAKSFELVGLGFLGLFLKESVDTLFIPSPAGTRAGIERLEGAVDVDGTPLYDSLDAVWEGQGAVYQREVNMSHPQFLGGIEVIMPTAKAVVDAALSRMPSVEEGTSLPVLFQWPHEASSVSVLYCEMGELLRQREADEQAALVAAKAKWQTDQVLLLKKLLGFEKKAEGEAVKMAPFTYERPPRETLKKAWTEQKLVAVEKEAVLPPSSKATKATFALEVPLLPGEYCYKFMVNGTDPYFKPSKAIENDDDGCYKMLTVSVEACFGLGFDVGI